MPLKPSQVQLWQSQPEQPRLVNVAPALAGSLVKINSLQAQCPKKPIQVLPPTGPLEVIKQVDDGYRTGQVVIQIGGQVLP